MIFANMKKDQWIQAVCVCFAAAAIWLMGIGAPFAQDPPAEAHTPAQINPPETDKPPTTPTPQNLFLALNSGDLGFFRTLLNAGANANTRDPNSGRTLLMTAEKEAMTQLLLTHGADPTLQDYLGATALHHAVTSAEALKIIPILLANGAIINAKAPGWSQETPFMVAKKLFFQHEAIYGAKVMQLLAQNGADINAADENGYTVLISAVVNDKPELVRLMIDLGADINQEANDGLTAMAWAIELGFVDIIELLEAAQQ